MKTLFITAILILLTAANSQADQYLNINKGISGLLLGAGGGALAGQAIGRNTESTLIGTAVGTVFGYIVGNEMDKNPGYTRQAAYPYQQPRAVPSYGQVRPYNQQYQPVAYLPEPAGPCREVEFLGTVQGQPQKFYSTACKTNQGWVLVEPQTQTTNSSYRENNQYRQEDHRYIQDNPYQSRVGYQY